MERDLFEPIKTFFEEQGYVCDVEVNDIDELKEDADEYAKASDKFSTIENIDDLRKFSGLPLECLQGFYFSHPLSAELFEDFVFSHAKAAPSSAAALSPAVSASSASQVLF